MEQRIEELSLAIDLRQSLHYVSFLIDFDINDRQNLILFHVSFSFVFGGMEKTSARHTGETLTVFFECLAPENGTSDKGFPRSRMVDERCRDGS
jgi:hypothetical protein